MKVLTDNSLIVLWKKIKDLYKKISVSAKQTTTSTVDGGTNVITFTFGDGTSTTLSVKNGTKGSDGVRGVTGAKGPKGDQGDKGDKGAKGDKGDAFKYSDFTPDQLAALKGSKGDRGPVGEIGPQGNSGIADASSKALINDAVTGGETSYLSAEVGKLGIFTYDCSKGGTIEHVSLQDAINAVPTTFQKAGISIIYKSGNYIYRYTLKTSSWSSDAANWFSFQPKEEGKGLIDMDVADSYSYISNEDYLIAVVDSKDRILAGIKYDGKPYFPYYTMYRLEPNSDWKALWLDEDNKLIFGIRKDGSIDWSKGIPSPIRKEISNIYRQINPSAIISRNRDQESRLYAAARCNTYKGEKDFQLCLIGDPHDPYSKGANNAVDVANYFSSIEAVLVLGDIQGWTPYDGNTNSNDKYGIKPFVDILDKCIKPWYLVVGNHDVGPCRYIPFARSHQQVWEDLIKPMVDRKFLRSSEINNSSDYASKCYYYHDFNNYKVRLIVLYEYGFSLELEDSNEFWETIDYDESAVEMQLGTTYTFEVNKPLICNCGKYKEHSFKLKKSVTTPYDTRENDGTMPQYKCRQLSFFTKEQMEWLASVLVNTPDGYGVIIASHQSLVAPSTLTNNKFSRGITPDNISPRQDGLSADMAMNVAIVPKIVDAWIKKKSISERIVASNRSGANEGNIEYLNTETDSDGKYAYMLNLDFSDRINNNAYFINYIAGHEHNDSIEQSVDYPSQKAIIVTTPNPPYRWMSDTATVEDQNSQAYDSLTIYSCNKDRIALTKYGNDITINGIKRDFEIIKL